VPEVDQIHHQPIMGESVDPHEGDLASPACTPGAFTRAAARGPCALRKQEEMFECPCRCETESAQDHYYLGHEAGREWSANYAEKEQLENLQELERELESKGGVLCDYFCVSTDEDSSAAELFVYAIEPAYEGQILPCWDFWSTVPGICNIGSCLEEPSFVHGFAEGALLSIWNMKSEN